MFEIGKEAKIPDLWRVPVLSEICPEEVKEQMKTRLDEIGEYNENIRTKMMFDTFRTVKIVFFVCVCLFRNILCVCVRFVFFCAFL